MNWTPGFNGLVFAGLLPHQLPAKRGPGERFNRIRLPQ